MFFTIAYHFKEAIKLGIPTDETMCSFSGEGTWSGILFIDSICSLLWYRRTNVKTQTLFLKFTLKKKTHRLRFSVGYPVGIPDFGSFITAEINSEKTPSFE